MNQARLNRMRRKVKSQLDKERYQHTIGVMYTAASLAMAHGADMDYAMIAGLLHDCAKCIPSERKFTLCKRYHLNVSDVEKLNPSLLHAKLGALIAAKKYRIREIEIINAIASHTTGRPEMSLLEKIVFLADYIEPASVEASNLDYIRSIAFKDIDLSLFHALKDTLAYLNEKDMELDPLTEKTFQYYKNKINNRMIEGE